VTLHRVIHQTPVNPTQGPWHSSASLRSLNRVVGELNRRYGPGTHRIESRDVSDAQAIVDVAQVGAT